MFIGSKVVWRSSEEIRDMIIRYYTARGTLDAVPANSWRIVPEAAHQQVVREAMQEAAQPKLK